MGETGYINWHRVANLDLYWHATDEGQTFVYGFWLVDYGSTTADDGVRMLKKSNQTHPDWFLYADTADKLLTGSCPPGIMVSNNHLDVFDERHGRFALKPTLGAVLLGTADCIYASEDRTDYWDCRYWHLTWRGKRTVRALSRLYERPVHIVTFLNTRPMRPADPEADGQATADTASGDQAAGR